MSPPDSDLIRVQDIPNAGRGVIAVQEIAQATVILKSSHPAAHVLFRVYRKEVCAQCFFYDRGRTLPVRDNSTGKVFCSEQCQTEWATLYGEEGVEAWRRLQTYIASRPAGRVSKEVDEMLSKAAVGRPAVDAIAAAYGHAASSMAEDASRKIVSRHLSGYPPDPDILAFFLDGHLMQQRDPETWRTRIEGLAQDPTPYATSLALTDHCFNYQHLCNVPWPAEASFLPIPPDLCHLLETASSHNAFGINAGGEDAEEYMGYGVYPEASYFNHSCAPNLVKERKGRSWEFRAAREIAEGAECCITYLGGDEKHLDVRARRKRLKDVWGFECMCLRCIAESEDMTS